jgi:hypothetical protein
METRLKWRELEEQQGQWGHGIDGVVTTLLSWRIGETRCGDSVLLIGCFHTSFLSGCARFFAFGVEAMLLDSVWASLGARAGIACKVLVRLCRLCRSSCRCRRTFSGEQARRNIQLILSGQLLCISGDRGVSQ